MNDPKSWDVSKLNDFLNIPFKIPEPLPQPDKPVEGPEVVDVVKTGFLPGHARNKFPLSRPNKKEKDPIEAAVLQAEYSKQAFNHTEKLRTQALGARHIRDVRHLQRSVCPCFTISFISISSNHVASWNTTRRLPER